MLAGSAQAVRIAGAITKSVITKTVIDNDRRFEIHASIASFDLDGGRVS
jgi:hypothetical protein